MKMLPMEVVMCGMNHLRLHSELCLVAGIWLNMGDLVEKRKNCKVGGCPVDAIGGSRRFSNTKNYLQVLLCRSDSIFVGCPVVQTFLLGWKSGERG